MLKSLVYCPPNLSLIKYGMVYDQKGRLEIIIKTIKK